MASDAGELVVKISADVSDMKAALQVLTQNVGQVGAETVASGNIMGDVFEKLGTLVVGFAKDSILAFGQQEQILVRLTNLVGTDASNSFQVYAEHIQETTAFSHEQVLAMDAQLAAFGLMPNEINKASEALIDYAAQTGKTLPEAADVLGRAMAGNSRELKALGVEIFATDDRSTKFNKTIETLTQKFGGVAEQMGGTTLGSLDMLKNSINDMQEEIGRFLASDAVGFTKWLTDLVKNISSSIRIITDFTNEIGGFGNVMESVFLEIFRSAADNVLKLLNILTPFAGILKLTGINFDNLKGSLDSYIDGLQSSIQTVNAVATATVKAEKSKVVVIAETQRAFDQYMSSLNKSIATAQMVSDHIVTISRAETEKKILDSQNALDKMTTDQERLTEITNLETEKRLMTSQQSWEANASFSDQFKVKLADDISKNTAAFADMADSAIKSFSDSTAKMIIEGGRFKDVMTNLWKNLAEQIISQIIRMIAEWMIWEAVSGGVGAGNPFAFLGHGAGGGMINEPSMVLGMKSGTAFIAGEAGPEAFGPPDQMNTLNASSSGGGGGGGGSGGGVTVNLNVSGQFIEGTPAKWQRMVQEQIIPQLRRFSMMQPAGVVTRKRGAMS